MKGNEDFVFQKTATQQPEKEDLEQERVRACEKVRERERKSE